MLTPYKYNKVRILDIDGTVLKHRPPEKYADKELLAHALEIVNAWFDAGDYIQFYTSRPSECYEMTRQQLDDFGFKYHSLVMDKVYAREIHYYDDAPITFHKVERDKGIGCLPEEELK